MNYKSALKECENVRVTPYLNGTYGMQELTRNLPTGFENRVNWIKELAKTYAFVRVVRYRGKTQIFVNPTVFYSIDDIKKANASIGHYFFSVDTMRFFGTRISPTIYHGNVFIINNRNAPSGYPQYKVCKIMPNYHIEYLSEHHTLASAKKSASKGEK